MTQQKFIWKTRGSITGQFLSINVCVGATVEPLDQVFASVEAAYETKLTMEKNFDQFTSNWVLCVETVEAAEIPQEYMTALHERIAQHGHARNYVDGVVGPEYHVDSTVRPPDEVMPYCAVEPLSNA